jgi:hypothetical protein
MTATKAAKAKTSAAKLLAPPPASAAHVGYQPPGYDLYGRRAKASYHVVMDESVWLDSPPPLCGITRYPGEALCGYPGDWDHIPFGLFPPPVSCPRCRQLADDLAITIDDE